MARNYKTTLGNICVRKPPYTLVEVYYWNKWAIEFSVVKQFFQLWNFLFIARKINWETNNGEFFHLLYSGKSYMLIRTTVAWKLEVQNLTPSNRFLCLNPNQSSLCGHLLQHLILLLWAQPCGSHPHHCKGSKPGQASSCPSFAHALHSVRNTQTSACLTLLSCVFVINSFLSEACSNCIISNWTRHSFIVFHSIYSFHILQLLANCLFPFITPISPI